MDLGRAVAALLVDRAHLPCVVDRAGGGDDLVLDARLGAQRVAPLDAGLGDVAVALGREGDAAAEPLLLAQLEDLLERVARVSSP